jgi:hypothetical protein
MKKKMPKLDMGGLYMGASKSFDVENQPVSGYGISDADRCPPNCKKLNAPKSKKGGIDYAKRRKRQNKIKNASQKRCRKGFNGQMICD